MLIQSCYTGRAYIPSLEDILKMVHDREPTPVPLYQMTKYQPYRRLIQQTTKC